jgi:hypothetical protein
VEQRILAERHGTVERAAEAVDELIARRCAPCHLPCLDRSALDAFDLGLDRRLELGKPFPRCNRPITLKSPGPRLSSANALTVVASCLAHDVLVETRAPAAGQDRRQTRAS